ncbi:GrpB family protein [Aeromonas veronii bv. sobria]|uniref:GrpB family protein n=1 Tax=Aeromonas veronii TaxID=654 RepID=UPI0035C184D9
MKFYSADRYQKVCEANYIHYNNVIKNLLPNARVEHIGASSIPLAISKGDLDIFVGVDSSDFEKAIQSLMTLGFREKKDTLRTTELCMLESNKNDNVALQVVVNGSEFEFFLSFRDKLLTNKSLANMYNELKLSCEGLSEEEYRIKKSTFIEFVLNQT